MITPRDSFKHSDFAKGWQSLVDSTQFQTAAQAALAEMALQSCSLTENGQTAAANQYGLCGAKQFLAILMNLTATETKQTPLQNNLNYNV